MSKINKKIGVSLLILVITIVVAIILVSTIAVTFTNINSSTLKKEFAKEIYTLNKLVNQYEFKNGNYPIKDSINVNVSDLDNISKTQFSSENGYLTGTILLNEIDLDKADVNSLSRGLKRKNDSKDIYAVSTTTGKVYYIKGEKIADTVYYTLTEELKTEIGL